MSSAEDPLLERRFLLDVLEADAWPAAEETWIGGWRVRATDGVTNRANSVLAVGGRVLPGTVEAIEAWYAERQLPARFWCSDVAAPLGLVGVLQERGYELTRPALIMTGDPAEVARRSAATEAEHAVELRDEHDEEWFEIFWGAELRAPGIPRPIARRAYRDVLLRPALPRAFGTAYIDGMAAGVGQVVLGERVGAQMAAIIQSMATAAEFRRRGVAGVLLGALARWATGQGATVLMLSVTAENLNAQRLYEAMGMTYSHNYRYWLETGRPMGVF